MYLIVGNVVSLALPGSHGERSLPITQYNRRSTGISAGFGRAASPMHQTRNDEPSLP